jgi:hypothetical protein
MTETHPDLDGQNLLQEIGQHIYPIQLTVSWPKMRKQLKQAKVLVENTDNHQDEEVDKDRHTVPQLINMPETWEKRFSEIEQRARKVITDSCRYVSVGKLHILPINKASDVFNGLAAIRDEFNGAAASFTAVYPEIYDANYALLRDKYGVEAANKIVASMPKKETVRHDFTMHWYILPICGSTAAVATVYPWQLDQITELIRPLAEQTNDPALQEAVQQLQQHSNSLTQGIHEVAEADISQLDEMIQEHAREFATSLLDNVCNGVRDELVQPLQATVAALLDGRPIRNDMLDSIREKFRRVRAFAGFTAPDLLTLMDQVEPILNDAEASDVNNDTAVGQQLGAALGSVMESASDDRNQVAAKRRFRRIRMHEEETADA